MIRHAAVCIVFRLFSTADDVILGGAARDRGDKRGDREDEAATGVIDGRARWRVSWVRRENMGRKEYEGGEGREGEKDEGLRRRQMECGRKNDLQVRRDLVGNLSVAAFLLVSGLFPPQHPDKGSVWSLDSYSGSLPALFGRFNSLSVGVVPRTSTMVSLPRAP